MLQIKLKQFAEDNLNLPVQQTAKYVKSIDNRYVVIWLDER
jgi:hypothetical protein